LIDALSQLDCELFLWVNRLSGPAWELGMGYGTWLGHGLAIAVLLALGLRRFDPRRFPKNAVLIGLATACAGAGSAAVKQTWSRPRPLAEPRFELSTQPVATRALPGGLEVQEWAVGNPSLAAIAPRLRVIGPTLRHRSFPSGHTAAAFGCAASLGYAFRGRRRWLGLAPAAFVGVSRVACGVHFPLDVASGALVGTLASLGFLRVFESFHGLAQRPQPVNRRAAGEPLRVMFVAGEASADVYGARILTALRAREPGVEAFGVGGDRLLSAGLTGHGHARELSIVGFTAVLARLPGLARRYLRLVRLLRERRPHVLVCIDLPDFNFMLAQQARGLGVAVLVFISPQFWAWRSGRVAKLADRISKMVVAFPFEAPFYQRAGVPVAFHGHPLVEGLPEHQAPRDAVLRRLGLDPARRTLVLAPGSRRSEWRHHRDALFGAAARLAHSHPDLQFAVPLAPDLSEAEVREAAARAGIDAAVARGDHHDLLAAADLGILCSGTITLEAALAGLPMLIFYRGNWLNAVVAKLVVKIDRIGLPNIVLGGDAPVFSELIQHRAGAAGLAAAAAALLDRPEHLAELRKAALRVREGLSGGATSQAVADEIAALADPVR
jgi:lipid-A-disaccharide synthase